jgi:hypothetical protein
MEACIHFRIWDSRSGGYEEYYLLGYKAVYYTESQPTFRKNISPPSLESKNMQNKKPSWKQVASRTTLKMEAICSSKTSVAFQQTTRRYIPEDSTLLYLLVRHNVSPICAYESG